MLKFNYLINLGLAGVLVVPPILLAQGGSVGLEKALADTLTALADLEGTRATIEAGDYAAVDLVKRSTEPALAPQQQQTVVLDDLRQDVGKLQMELDTLLDGHRLPPLDFSDVETGGDPSEDLATTTVGLSEADRAKIGEILPPVAGGPLPGPTTPAGGKQSLEKEGFSADPVRHGRAYYRAGRYEEALRLLRRRSGDAEADYWVGRCMERLSRPLEAIAAYDRVIANQKAGSLADRAKTDRDFLTWKQSFDRRIQSTTANEGSR